MDLNALELSGVASADSLDFRMRQLKGGVMTRFSFYKIRTLEHGGGGEKGEAIYPRSGEKLVRHLKLKPQSPSPSLTAFL